MKSKLLVSTVLLASALLRAEGGGFEAANNALALKMYDYVRVDKAGKSMVFSPSSLDIALSALYAGTAGATEAEMKAALQFPDQQTLAPSFAAWQKQLLDGAGKAQLEIANAFFPRIGFPFESDTVEMLRKIYEIDVIPLDYGKNPGASTGRINQWGSEKTHGRIPEVLKQPLSRDTVFVLANAVYFKGSWEVPFNKKTTRDAPFFIAPEQSVAVPFMNRVGAFDTGTVDGVDVIELPYADSTYAMLIALPADREAGALEKVERALSAERIAQWRESLKPNRRALSMPKFKVKSEIFCIPFLRQIGLKNLLSSDVDFSRFTKEKGMGVSEVKQDACIDVDEEGTVAAAVTVIAVARSMPLPAQPFTIDRPFLFMILEKTSGTLLFMGRVSDPRETN